MKKHKQAITTILPVCCGLLSALLPAPANAQMQLRSTNLFSGSAFGTAGADLIANCVKVYNGAVYLGGNNSAASGFVAAYNTPLNSAATPNWRFTWPDTDVNDLFFGITATPTGLYLAGPDETRTVDPVGSKEAKGLVVKFPFSGATGGGFGGAIWDRQTPAAPGAFSYGGAESLQAVTATTESGTTYLYATGDGQSSGANGGRLFLSKLAEDSTVLWTVTDGAEQVGVAYSQGCAITSLNGNLFIAGRNDDLNSLSAPYLRAYTPSGTLLWRRNEPFAGYFYGITTISNYLYVVGYAGSNVGPNATLDFLVEKWDTSGNRIWSRSYDRNSKRSILNAVVTLSGRLFAVGSTTGGTAGGSDAVLVEFNPANGDLLSTTLFGGAQDDVAMGVDTDGSDLYVVGQTKSFGNGAGQAMLLRYTPQPVLSMGLFTGLTINGVVGSKYEIDYTTVLNHATNWTALSTVVLTNSSTLFFDTNSVGAPQRFYRAVLVP